MITRECSFADKAGRHSIGCPVLYKSCQGFGLTLYGSCNPGCQPFNIVCDMKHVKTSFTKPYIGNYRSVKSGDLGSHGTEPQRPIHNSLILKLLNIKQVSSRFTCTEVCVLCTRGGRSSFDFRKSSDFPVLCQIQNISGANSCVTQ
jgi:hypothetical protein